MATGCPVELDDIQGLVRFAYKHHTEAVFLLLRITDAPRRAPWLGRGRADRARHRKPLPSTALQVALTSEGLRALGVARRASSTASRRSSSKAWPGTRAARDVWATSGANDPSRWHWGSGERVPHVAVLLYALPGLLQDLQQTIEAQLRAGFEIMDRLATSDMGNVEPFGFVDGISQPEMDWNRRRAGEAMQPQLAYRNLSCLGEFLLGYPNEYGLYTPRPLLEPGRDAQRTPAACRG